MKKAIHLLIAAVILQGSLTLLGASPQGGANGQTGQATPGGQAAQAGQTAPAGPTSQPAQSGQQSGQTNSSAPAPSASTPAAPGAGSSAAAPAAANPAAPASMQSLTSMQAPFDPTKTIIILPRGSVIHMKLQTTLTSKTNKSGDKFQGMVTQPVVANDKVLVPEGSMVDGHVVMAKSSGRIAGRASMRIVLDHINTPDDVNFNLNADLQDFSTSTCTKGIGDNEGTIKGCGKSKKSAAEAAGIAGGIGAASGASIGATEDMICRYYGCPGQDPNILKDAGIGAAIGGGTALMYSLLRHEKQIVLVSGSELTFVVDRTVEQQPSTTTADAGGS